MAGALSGLRVIEMAGLGPCPLVGQMLADHGAEVIVIDRKSGPADPADVNRRGKKSVALNLKDPSALRIAKDLIATADMVIEGFRPGVMEKLGLGPKDLPDSLIYGRMTGWGQDGPLAHTAGHDLNYLAITGALGAIGEKGRPPVPPLNLVADYGGGAMFLLFGVLAALFSRTQTGKGQVVDAAMVDGVPAMMGLLHWMLAHKQWTPERADNLLDGAAPFYRCYECADGKYLSVGAIEPQFFADLVRLSGLPEAELQSQNDKDAWGDKIAAYARVFAQKTRDDWATIFEGTDACAAPVLNWAEVEAHPHNAARGTFTRVNDVMQAAPAPRFDGTPADAPAAPAALGGATEEVLQGLGLSTPDLDRLRASGALT